MMRKPLFVLFFIIVAGIGAALAQARTVTNDDLAQYREKRLAAERDLRENYAKFGFPSPDELARRNERAAKELSETAARLRAERAARERLAIEELRAAATRSAPSRTEVIYFGGEPYYYYYYPNGYYQFYGQRTGRVQDGYFAGGQFWPTGPRTRPMPMFATPQHK